MGLDRWSRLRRELASAPDVVPPEFSSEGSDFEVFEVEGETWATLAPNIGAIRLLHRQGGDWVEVPVASPQPPPRDQVGESVLGCEG